MTEKKIEFWDLYNKDKQKLNKIHRRGDKLPPGEYFLAVNIWIINDKNEMLLTQRHPDKFWPLKWECTGGAVLAGEDSYTGALREVEEETGIRLKTCGKLIDTIMMNDYIKDIYVFMENINIEDTKPEAGSVINIKWASIEELNKMAENNEIAEPVLLDMKELGKILACRKSV